ncbi:Pentatricopeptide repeat [Dillenia turbinata]|uniref:Pentatricopeptide repeat n=1 Tax=Dillenia turbinata TaxID=194707 RepID=A0AAN8UYU4_9MAGN
MEKIVSPQNLNPSFLSRKKPIPYPATKSLNSFSLLRVANTSLERQISVNSPPSPFSSNGFFSDFGSFSHYFPKLKSLNSVKQLHTQITKMGKEWSSDALIRNLISSYLEFGDYRSAARAAFVYSAQINTIWNVFLEGVGGNSHEILKEFRDLHNNGFEVEIDVFSVVLKICTNSMDRWLGIEIHACSIKRGFESNVSIQWALMNFYERCWGINSANEVFLSRLSREALLWNEAILMNLRNEKYTDAIKLFKEMQFMSFKVESFIIARVLQACAKLGALNEGKQMHAFVYRRALEENVMISNSLINMYSKEGNLELARRVFESMENRNISSWNTIISSYATLGYLNDALKLFNVMKISDLEPDIITWNCLLSGHFLSGAYEEVLIMLRQMQAAGYKPNSNSISTLIQAISKLGYLKVGKEIFGYVIRNRLDCDVYVGTSLLDMYVKNGDLNNAQAIFDNMDNKNIIAWNSLISGYAYKGQFEDAVKLLNQMEKEGIRPNLVTFNGLIYGYSIWGHIKEASSMIDQAKSSGLAPNVVSWTALISGCSQSGRYKDALKFFLQMQREGINPNSATISSLVQACAGQSWLQKGAEIHCLSMRNGLIEDVVIATALLDMYSKSGVKIRDAWSWIHVHRTVHVFSTKQKPHMDEGEIYFELYHLVSELKKLGYVPDVGCVYQDISDAEKEKILLSHTEKLAITYGLMKTKTGEPLRVIKNAKICSDCHNAAKYITLVRNREIFLRDGIRFHHFREGKCSCNDCW